MCGQPTLVYLGGQETSFNPLFYEQKLSASKAHTHTQEGEGERQRDEEEQKVQYHWSEGLSEGQRHYRDMP